MMIPTHRPPEMSDDEIEAALAAHQTAMQAAFDAALARALSHALTALAQAERRHHATH